MFNLVLSLSERLTELWMKCATLLALSVKWRGSSCQKEEAEEVTMDGKCQIINLSFAPMLDLDYLLRCHESRLTQTANGVCVDM